MNAIPEELKYTQTHEWVRVEGNEVIIGITHHAQELLGDMVYVELPETGSCFSIEEDCAVVESVKAASDIYAPLDGEIIAVNDNLADSPELINQSPYEEGWLIRMKITATEQLDNLLDANTYQDVIASEDSK